jgi:hypothetical protein
LAIPKEGSVPASHDCKACRFIGKQKYKEDVCGLTGNTCLKWKQGGDFTLSPYGKEVYMLWNAVQSQWRVGFSGPTGLDYTAVKVIADTLGIDWDEQLLKHIQSLEGATLKYFAEQTKKAETKAK